MQNHPSKICVFEGTEVLASLGSSYCNDGKRRLPEMLFQHSALEDALRPFRQKRQINRSLAKGWKDHIQEMGASDSMRVVGVDSRT